MPTDANLCQGKHTQRDVRLYVCRTSCMRLACSSTTYIHAHLLHLTVWSLHCCEFIISGLRYTNRRLSTDCVPSLHIETHSGDCINMVEFTYFPLWLEVIYCVYVLALKRHTTTVKINVECHVVLTGSAGGDGWCIHEAPLDQDLQASSSKAERGPGGSTADRWLGGLEEMAAEDYGDGKTWVGGLGMSETRPLSFREGHSQRRASGSC